MQLHQLKKRKRGTLETLIERACSTDKLRNRKLKHIEKVSYENNCYPKCY